ncbi:contractile injection system tape measure protein [Vibrio sp. WXL103]|uniref:contractile injection system tape measure protein n=1 Tax=Vibrio sp. WXL103 TaxID=3450710 RepID=UPI003EC69305
MKAHPCRNLDNRNLDNLGTHHAIQAMTFDVGFDSLSDADTFIAEVAEQLLNVIMPSIEALFDQLLPADMALQIDTINIDLGEITSDRCFATLCQRLTQQLYDQLSQKLGEALQAQQTSLLPRQRLDYSSSNTQDTAQHLNVCYWQKAWRFLNSGHLEWPFRSIRPLRATGIEQVIVSNRHQLDNHIRQSLSPRSVCARIALQLSPETVVILLPVLSKPHRILILSSLLVSHDSHNQAFRQAFDQAWVEEISRAFQQQDITSLLPHWDTLMRRCHRVVLSAVYQQTNLPLLPELLTTHLTQAQRFTLLKHLEPSHFSYLHQILSRPQYWELRTPVTNEGSRAQETRSTNSHVPYGEKIDHLLWCFTFEFVLVERGSRFNQQQYMRSLIIHLSAEQNLHLHSVVMTLRHRLTSVANRNALQQQMLETLLGLENQWHQVTTPRATTNENQPSRSVSPDLATLNQPQANTALTDANITKGEQPSLAHLRLDNLTAHSRYQVVTFIIQHPSLPLGLWAQLLNADSTFITPLRRASEQSPFNTQQAILALSQQHAIRDNWLAQLTEQALVELVKCVYQSACADIMELKEVVERLNTLSSTQTRLSIQLDLRQLLYKPLLSNADQQNDTRVLFESILSAIFAKIATDNSSTIEQVTYRLSSLLHRETAPRNPTRVELCINNIFQASARLISDDLEHAIKLVQSNHHSVQLSRYQRKHIKHYLCTEAACDTRSIILQRDWLDAPNVLAVLNQFDSSLASLLANQLVMICHLVKTLKFSRCWFYQTLLQPSPPTTCTEWVRVILQQQMTEQPNWAVEKAQLEIFACIKLADINHDKQEWLQAALPAVSLTVTLEEWLQPNMRPTARDVSRLMAIIERQPDEFWPVLCNALRQRSSLEAWSLNATPAIHITLIAQYYPRLVAPLTSLYRAIATHFGNQAASTWFWPTVYQHIVSIPMNTLSSHDLLGVLNNLCQQQEVLKRLPDPDSSNRATQLLSLLGLANQAASLPAQLSQAGPSSQIEPSSNPSIQSGFQPSKPMQSEHRGLATISQTNDPASPRFSPKKSIPTPLEWLADKHNQDTTCSYEVKNAGLVIAATYIPTLLQRLGLTEQQQFIDPASKTTAVFCLQYLVEGHDCAPEYWLMLNKLLCGMALDEPIVQRVALTKQTKTTIDGLIMAMINHWQALGSTSVEGLRSTFFQRDGVLQEQQQHWHLRVVPGTFDMLLDQLPWSFNTIKYPWMNKPLFVTWR